MFEPVLGTVIYLDTDSEMVHIYTLGSGESRECGYFVGACKAKPFSKAYYEKLGDVIAQYRESHPDVQLSKVSVVIPDSVVMTDNLHVPTLSKRAMNGSVDVLLSNLYRNSADIRFNRFISLQTKEYATFSVVGVQRRILAGIQKALSEYQVGVANVTFASNTVADGIIALNPKLKAASFVALDVRGGYTRLVFVAKGKTVGFYTIPFGTEILSKTRVNAEDLLFDHQAAELLVLNSKEKAKAKALTVIEPEVVEDPDAEDAAEVQSTDGAQAEPTEGAEAQHRVATVASRHGRKLPKFMQRPIPTTDVGFAYENFRHILKWALGLIASNEGIKALGAPECMYVNLPEEYSFLISMANSEDGGCGIMLAPLTFPEGAESALECLELYGGFYAKLYNKVNNFSTGKLFDVFKDDEEEE